MEFWRNFGTRPRHMQCMLDIAICDVAYFIMSNHICFLRLKGGEIRMNWGEMGLVVATTACELHKL